MCYNNLQGFNKKCYHDLVKVDYFFQFIAISLGLLSVTL